MLYIVLGSISDKIETMMCGSPGFRYKRKNPIPTQKNAGAGFVPAGEFAVIRIRILTGRR